MKPRTAPSVDRIELMQTFVRIVEAGSLSAAAVQLGTTQPTVSRRLQALERLLGLRLLQRSTHDMALTSDGERCYAHAKELAATWNAMEADLRGARDEPRGTLRVLVPHAFGQDQMVAPLTDYLRRYSEVSVEWLLQDRHADFIAEGLDCAIQIGAVNEPDVVAILLAEVPRIVVAAPSLLPEEEPMEDVEALQALPWVALSTYYRNEVVLTRSADSRAHRFPIRPRMSTDSLYALRTAMLDGLGAGISSAWIVAEDIRQGRLRHVVPPWRAASLPVYLIYPYARYYPAKLRIFIELMRAAMPTMSGMAPPAPAPAPLPPV